MIPRENWVLNPFFYDNIGIVQIRDLRSFIKSDELRYDR
jgi:hypothetical protein